MRSEIRTLATQIQSVAPHFAVGLEKGACFSRGPSREIVHAFVLLFLVFPRAGWPQSNNLQKLFADYYEFRLRDDPTLATFVGRADFNDRWDDPSPAHQEQYLAALQQFLRRLEGIPKAGLTAADRLSYDLLDRELKEEIEEVNKISTYDSVNQLVGGHLNVFTTTGFAPAHTVKDYEDQVARLARAAEMGRSNHRRGESGHRAKKDPTETRR